VFETREELIHLQSLLDESFEAEGSHMKGILTSDRRLSAEQLCEHLLGMRLLAVATTTADGRPLVGAVDSYFLHGSFYFSSGRHSVRMRHLATRPHVSAIHLPGEELAVTVHGQVELFDVLDPAQGSLREAMLDYYSPKQGSEFEVWLNEADPIGARIDARKIFTFQLEE
jgi:uncharacterized pyridoxamine 5'-phosphate oxidase family protein